MLLTPIEMAG